MDHPEASLAQAERHVRDSEERVAHQSAIVGELDRDNQREAAGRARRVMVTLREGSDWLLPTCRRGLFSAGTINVDHSTKW